MTHSSLFDKVLVWLAVESTYNQEFLEDQKYAMQAAAAAAAYFNEYANRMPLNISIRQPIKFKYAHTHLSHMCYGTNELILDHHQAMHCATTRIEWILF